MTKLHFLGKFFYCTILHHTFFNIGELYIPQWLQCFKSKCVHYSVAFINSFMKWFCGEWWHCSTSVALCTRWCNGMITRTMDDKLEELQAYFDTKNSTKKTKSYLKPPIILLKISKRDHCTNTEWSFKTK